MNFEGKLLFSTPGETIYVIANCHTDTITEW